MFSFYLSHKLSVKGKMVFGGWDQSLFKQGKTDSDIYWMDQSANEAYWAVNSKGAFLGETELYHPANQ